MIDHILLAIACALLGVIAFRKPIHPRLEAQEPDIPPASDAPRSGHLAEVERQERFIDDWVDSNCERTHDPEVLMHQRWEGLKHYNRSKKQ